MILKCITVESDRDSGTIADVLGELNDKINELNIQPAMTINITVEHKPHDKRSGIGTIQKKFFERR